MVDPALQPLGIVDQQSGPPNLDDESITFLWYQRDQEIRFGHYSESFGPSLLAGMTVQPIFTVPKKGSSKLHLVNDHSVGRHSLNSLIPADGGFVKLDNISDLVTNICAMMAQNGGHHPAWLWKSDASQVYHQLPMHPRWQAHQATLIDGGYHVDHCAVFGNCTSGQCWCLFFGLVCWIMIHECKIGDILHYVNDAFSASFSHDLSLYQPYNCLMPTPQVKFLKLLDEIGLPHESAKQQHGCVLEIIGFEVDLLRMAITLPPDAKSWLVSVICDFVQNPSSPCQHPMCIWLHILGYANWALNVFPLLKPALNSCYDKVAGRTFLNAPIFLNKRTTEDLLWFADQVECLDGV